MVLDPFIENDFKYNSKIKVYPNNILKYTVFNKFVFNPDSYELVNNKKRSSYKKSDDSVVRSDSLKRSKDKIFDIAYINSDIWQYMVTFTLNKEKISRVDKKEITNKLKKWLQNIVQRNDANYLLIPEYHSDGVSIHFHGFLSGNFNLSFSSKYDKSGREIYNILNWRFGFSTVVKLDDNKIAVCKYITKYITKDSKKILGNIYYCGGKKIKRDVPCVYQNIDYNEFIGKEFKIPDTNIKVKYSIVGFLGE